MDPTLLVISSLIGLLLVIFFFAGVKIIRPTHRGLIEVFGKYHRFALPGFHWVFPVVAKIYLINVIGDLAGLSAR